MTWVTRLMPRTITAQITGLVAVSVLLGITFLIAFLLLVLGPPSGKDDPSFTVARISEVTRLVRAAATPIEADVVLAATQATDLKARRVALADLQPTSAQRALPARLAVRQLAAQPGVDLVDGLRDPTGPPSQIIVKLDPSHAIVFDVVIKARLLPFILTPTALLVVIVTVSMLLLSIYAVRWVVAPLAEVASAATAFGRSPQAHAALNRRGPREIIQVTDALNDMRTRIQALLDDRTRMLAAISHDLRTPLTRLRLRAERIDHDTQRAAILADLAKVSGMIDDTLEYLRDDARSEPVSRIDLPSFLQTICSEFSDMGHDVTYQGPARLPHGCRPRAMGRAVTNIVENAVKHGDSIVVTLTASAPDHVAIEVADDGPGIPADLRAKVFEPFFKADDARRPNAGGFGLGLSIAQEIIKRHGGGIELMARAPRGLRVLMTMPSAMAPDVAAGCAVAAR